MTMTGDTLISLGGAVKALDDSGRIGGAAVVFGFEDLSRWRDVFAEDTRYGRALKTGADLTFNHSLPTIGLGSDVLPNALADRVLGDVELKVRRDEADVWMDGVLNLSDKYERLVFDAVKAGKLGVSTGADPTRVRRVRQDNGSYKVTDWPIIHVSLTPVPASPHTYVHAIKSLSDWAAETAVKCGPYGYDGPDGPDGKPDPARSAALSVVERLASMLSMVAYQTISRNDGPLPKRLDTLRAAFDQHRDLSVRAVEALLSAPEADVAEALAETKTLWLGALASAMSNLRMTDHSEATHAVNSGFFERARSYEALKSSDGHAIPAGRLAEIARFGSDVAAFVAACQPRPDPRRVDNLLAQFAVTKARYGLG